MPPPSSSVLRVRSCRWRRNSASPSGRQRRCRFLYCPRRRPAMKLYYAPAACSQAPHSVAREAGLPVDLVKVEFPSQRTADGESLYDVNPKGAVPALRLDDGEVLTENAVILQYLADKAPGSGLALPASGTERWRQLEWLNFIATELHKGFGPLWNPATPDAFKEATRDALGKKFDYLQEKIGDGPYI